MNTLKIPNLNLFRGKRESRVDQMTHIQQKGLKLLKKTNNKELIDEIQAELYLDNYRMNLKHFVSPTKYKDQAEKYLKENKISDQIYLRALQLPKQKKFCPNCFDQYLKTSKKCYCQIQAKIPPMYRYKQSDTYYKQDREPKFINVINQQVKERKRMQIKIQQSEIQERKQEQIASRDFILTESDAPQEQNTNVVEQPIKQQSKSIVQTINNRVIPDSSFFMKQMKRRQNYLQNINMEITDSRTDIDFQGLNQARRQYINKSHEILDRLNEIIRQHSS